MIYYEDSNTTIQDHDKITSPQMLHEDREPFNEPEHKRRRNEGDSNEDLNVGEVKNAAFSTVEAKEELPPYLPAIMGCRSVSEFQCLNK